MNEIGDCQICFHNDVCWFFKELSENVPTECKDRHEIANLIGRWCKFFKDLKDVPLTASIILERRQESKGRK